MYFVYILVCLKTGRSYVGQTDNLLRRFSLHRSGSTKTTLEKLIQPVLVHWESFASRSAAMQRERYYKAGAGHRVKHDLIAANLRAFWPEL